MNPAAKGTNMSLQKTEVAGWLWVDFALSRMCCFYQKRQETGEETGFGREERGKSMFKATRKRVAGWEIIEGKNKKGSLRVISTAWLNVLPRVHLPPIDAVVFCDPYNGRFISE